MGTSACSPPQYPHIRLGTLSTCSSFFASSEHRYFRHRTRESFQSTEVHRKWKREASLRKWLPRHWAEFLVGILQYGL